MKARPQMPFLLALAMAGLTACTTGHAILDCVGPSLTVSERNLAPGAVVQVEGKYFFADCPSDHSTPFTAETEPNALVFSQKDEVHALVSVVADPETSGFTIDVVIPKDAKPGPGQIRLADKGSSPAKVTISSVPQGNS